MQDNAIIIKLQDGDITTAQDDVDIEGIIHIPSIEYDHCVQEVQVPGQSFFNELYLNVQDLNIGGSGLPIIISQIIPISGSDIIYTRDLNTVPISTVERQSVQYGESLIAIREDISNNIIGLSAITCTPGASPVTIVLSNPGPNTIILKYIKFRYVPTAFVLKSNNGDWTARLPITTRSSSSEYYPNYNELLIYKPLFEIDWGNN